MVDMKSLFEAERARRIEAKRATAAAEETSSSNADEIRAAPAPCDLSPRTPLRLADHAVGADRGVAGLHYVPDFLSADEEAAVLRGVYAPDAASRWVASGQRRVQNWGGRPSELDVAEPLPPFAAALARAVSDAGVVAEGAAPNHVLVNEYRRPAGITPHNDGDIYNPRVAIVTLSGGALIDFWAREGPASETDDEDARRPDAPSPRAQVYLRPRSLLLYEGDAYALRHGIREASVDRITPLCVNAAVAGVKVGDEVERGETRVSVVFVRKERR